MIAFTIFAFYQTSTDLELALGSFRFLYLIKIKIFNYRASYCFIFQIHLNAFLLSTWLTTVPAGFLFILFSKFKAR